MAYEATISSRPSACSMACSVGDGGQHGGAQREVGAVGDEHGGIGEAGDRQSIRLELQLDRDVRPVTMFDQRRHHLADHDLDVLDVVDVHLVIAASELAASAHQPGHRGLGGHLHHHRPAEDRGRGAHEPSSMRNWEVVPVISSRRCTDGDGERSTTVVARSPARRLALSRLRRPDESMNVDVGQVDDDRGRLRHLRFTIDDDRFEQRSAGHVDVPRRDDRPVRGDVHAQGVIGAGFGHSGALLIRGNCMRTPGLPDHPPRCDTPVRGIGPPFGTPAEPRLNRPCGG